VAAFRPKNWHCSHHAKKSFGLAQYDPPVISRVWSLDYPVEIKEGMTFALEAQHGKRFRYGVRIEEMLIVNKNEMRSSPISR
jgi:Xaa-Pro aminopeptidase